MGNIVIAAVLIVFEISLTFTVSGSADIYSIYLPPRFLGYLLLLVRCRALNGVEVFHKRRPVLKLMFFLELIKWVLALFRFSEISTWFWFAASIISICGMLFAVRTIADAMLEIEERHTIDAGAGELKKAWRLMLVGLLFVFTMKSKALSTIVWIFAAIFGVNYCVKLSRLKAKLLTSLPYNVLDEYK